jgi:hypothetical protein
MKFITKTLLKKDITEDSKIICDPIQITDNGDQNGLFVTIKSFDKELKHKDLNSLLNKKVKITIEVEY